MDEKMLTDDVFVGRSGGRKADAGQRGRGTGRVGSGPSRGRRAIPAPPVPKSRNAVARFPEVDCQWAPNEKVATEVAFGAAMAGARAMTCMKHVGVNVAADPIFTAAYTGVNRRPGGGVRR